MNLPKILDGSVTQFGTMRNAVTEKERINGLFYKSVFDVAKGSTKVFDGWDIEYDKNGKEINRTPRYINAVNASGEWTLSEFLNLQKSSESSAALASYLDLKGLTLASLGSDAGEKLNSQINTQASLQVIQNFYDMYISPVGETDVKYRLGEVTGKATAGTVNNQTDKYGRLRTRSLYNTKVDYHEWRGSNIVPATEYYSVLWFPPFNPTKVKAISWKNTSATIVDTETGLEIDRNGYLLDSSGNRIKYTGADGKTYFKKAGETKNKVNSMSMSDYIAQSKEKRQKELDEKNKELIEDGKEKLVTETVVEDTRLSTGESDRYYPTFDSENFLAARSSFTYRAPGFKAINDNINLLQWVLEGVSGITSTFLTEWDISLYLQEGLISDTQGALPNMIMLTHRLDADNPSGYSDERATSWGVLNCAISKIYGDNKKTWAINAFPYSTWHTLYPDPTQYSGWLDKIVTEAGDEVYIPNYYKFAKHGLTNFINGKDRNYKKRPDSVQTRLMFQDFEGAALSGWTEWNFNNKIWKALYTTDDDGFSDVDLIYLQTSAGLYKKKDLIEAVQLARYGVSGDGEFYDGSDMVVAGGRGDGNNSTTGYSVEDPVSGSGGNKFCPGSVFKGALTFLKMFSRKSSSKEGALAAANSVAKGNQGNTYGVMQDSLGLVKTKGSGTPTEEGDTYLLGMEKNLLDNSSGLGVPQYNPVLYGGPHSYYRSPKSYQSYYQENSLYLRNIPRVDKCPEDFTHDSFAGINWPSLPSRQDDYYYKGNEKWCSNVGAVENGERQAYEQSWSAGLSRLKSGIHHYSLAPAYLKVKVYSKVKMQMSPRYHWYERFGGRRWWRWYHHEWDLVRPKTYYNGEDYHYYGDWWWEWYTESLPKTIGWFWHSFWDHDWYDTWYDNYHCVSWYYRYGGRWTWYLQIRYLAPTQNAWHYEWHWTYFKRYVLHSEPELDWKIVQAQHYYSYLANFEGGLTSLWRRVYSKMFGYSKPYERLYAIGANEDYEFLSEGAGTYSEYGLYDEKARQVLSFKMTGNEHRIMTNIVDWGGGIGAHNKMMFLTRDGNGNPDCLFRCECYHGYKPVFYYCEHSKTYSSRRTEYWWERHNGWKHYISVKLYTTDRFYAGLSKPSFTNYGSSSMGEGAWGASQPPENGILSNVTVENSILRTHDNKVNVTINNCLEWRKSPFDLMTLISGRPIPRYNPDYGADEMAAAYKGIVGKGIIGDIPGLDFEPEDNGPEIFSDKLACDQYLKNGNPYATAFNKLTFPIWKVAGWNTKNEVSFNGNTYRPAGNGFAVYEPQEKPLWWDTMILNMSLRNTFYLGSASGPMKETFDISSYNVDVEGLSMAGGITTIADKGVIVNSATGSFTLRANDIKSYTTMKKMVIRSNGITESRDFVKTVSLKNAWSAQNYYFTSYDITSRFFYNMLLTQSGYFKFAKDFICGRTIGLNGQKGDYIVSFDFIRKIMEGEDGKTQGLISPRTYYLADPKRPYIADDGGDFEIVENNKKVKVSLCEDMYGYNPWIKTAREWFCNSKSENNKKHQEIEDELTRRMNVIAKTVRDLEPYLARNMGSYSYNDMIASWRVTNEFLELKNVETPEEFLIAYLNVLYEARRYFINKRCNKQDGTLWACRHLEKLLPQVVASAVASSANINTTAFAGTTRKEQVAFYEINNTLSDKMNVLKAAAKDKTVKNDVDRIKIVYVKVQYATYADYLNNLEKVKNGTLAKTDERIVPVTPISFIKMKNGKYKNKDSGVSLREGESWNNEGWAIKKGKVKYAIKPADGKYKLYSREKHQDEDNMSKKAANPKYSDIIYNYDNAVWNIDWSKMAQDNQILYNYFGGVNTSKLKDLAASGALDPQAMLCAVKEAADYWIVPVQTNLPDASGYKSQLTLEMVSDSVYSMEELGSSNNPTALVGAAAYAMWPIIEDQTDAIPNSGDLAQALQSMF